MCALPSSFASRLWNVGRACGRASLFRSVFSPSGGVFRSVLDGHDRFSVDQRSSCLDDATQIRSVSNRSRRGLYNGKDVRFGNRVSFSNRKTRRKFNPNVFLKRVYSETLDEMIRFHLTASTLRSIDKAGGLDNYLLTSKYVTEGEGMVAKNRILSRKKLLARLERKTVAAEENEEDAEEEDISQDEEAFTGDENKER